MPPYIFFDIGNNFNGVVNLSTRNPSLSEFHDSVQVVRVLTSILPFRTKTTHCMTLECYISRARR